MTDRRRFVWMTSLVAAGVAAAPRMLLAAPPARFAAMADALTQLEKDNRCRLGVALLDTDSGELGGHRLNERFAMCSTFKSLLAATVLQRADAGKESLDRMVAMPAKFVSYSPLTEVHAGGSMSVRDLCAAAVTRSDNTAANLLLETIGGPSGITSFARSLGDTITRLDRNETTLNDATPGDPRDTTSPAAMVADWRKILLGNTLSQPSRKQLTDWLIANKTGDERLRKGLTAGWLVGDKTGSNGETTSNDVAILWPGKRAPVILAAYLTECIGPETRRSEILAQVGRIAAKAIAST